MELRPFQMKFVSILAAYFLEAALVYSLPTTDIVKDLFGAAVASVQTDPAQYYRDNVTSKVKGNVYRE